METCEAEARGASNRGLCAQAGGAAHRLMALAKEADSGAIGSGQIDTNAEPHWLASRSILERPSAVRQIRVQAPFVGSRTCWASPCPSKAATHRPVVESGVPDDRARSSSDVLRCPSFAA